MDTDAVCLNCTSLPFWEWPQLMSRFKLLHTEVDSPKLSTAPPSLSPCCCLWSSPSPCLLEHQASESQPRPLVCDSSLSASVFSSRACRSRGKHASASVDVWGLASGPGAGGLLVELLARPNGPCWRCKRKRMRRLVPTTLSQQIQLRTVSVKWGIDTTVCLHCKWDTPPSISSTMSSKSFLARRTSFRTKYPRADAYERYDRRDRSGKGSCSLC